MSCRLGDTLLDTSVSCRYCDMPHRTVLAHFKPIRFKDANRIYSSKKDGACFRLYLLVSHVLCLPLA